MPLFRRIARRTARRTSRRVARRQEAEQQAGGAAPSNAEEELKNLAELHTQGVLTDEEFAAKKKQILGI